MTRPTDQQLQEELAQVVQKHNEAQEVVNQMKTRYTQIQAILDDRKADAVEVVPTTPEQTTQFVHVSVQSSFHLLDIVDLNLLLRLGNPMLWVLKLQQTLLSTYVSKNLKHFKYSFIRTYHKHFRCIIFWLQICSISPVPKKDNG